MAFIKNVICKIQNQQGDKGGNQRKYVSCGSLWRREWYRSYRGERRKKALRTLWINFRLYACSEVGFHSRQTRRGILLKWFSISIIQWDIPLFRSKPGYQHRYSPQLPRRCWGCPMAWHLKEGSFCYYGVDWLHCFPLPSVWHFCVDHQEVLRNLCHHILRRTPPSLTVQNPIEHTGIWR